MLAPGPLALEAMSGHARNRYHLGIVGAGQLARMTCLAALPLGVRVAVLGGPDEPAADAAAGRVDGSWTSAEDVAALAAVCDVITLENEFVDAAALAQVESKGTPVRPTSQSVAVVQDKARQKALLSDSGLPVADWRVATDDTQIAAAGDALGWPIMVKARTLGYDGYGNALCADAHAAVAALARLDRGEGVLVERVVPFERELAAMVARTPSGEAVAYPVVETVQRNHVCHEVTAPAAIDPSIAARAREIALRAAAAADAIGVMGVEMFQLPDGAVLVNELAPRPHNSGHYTIEACETSQFENHVRGVLDLPLGDVTMRMPAAVMVNILGSREGPPRPRVDAALQVTGAHLHLYDKQEVRMGRKMGHVTALGTTVDEAAARARAAVEAVGL